MGAVSVRVDASGKLIVPKGTLQALGIPDGGELRLAADRTAGQEAAVGLDTVAELRALVHPWRRPAGSVVEGLLLDRQLEATLESFDIPEARRLRAAIAAVRD